MTPSLSLTHTHGGWRLPLSWAKPIFSTTIFHFLLKSLLWRHLTRDFRASLHHHCYCSMPTALIWCQTCLGLCFCVCISISRFRSLFVFGFVCQMSRERLTRPTSSATTIGDANIDGHWSLSSFAVLFFFFFSFGLVFCLFVSWSIYGLGFLIWYKDLVIFYLGLKWVWVWSFVDLWIFFYLRFVSKWF